MAALSGRELLALLILRQLPGLHDERLRALVAAHGTLEAVLDAPARVVGHAAAAARRSRTVLERAERGAAAVAELGVRVVREQDPEYPARLKHLTDPPFALFARGDLTLPRRRCAAVVGSRRHTEYGADAARGIASALGSADVVVVSGLARGIDGHAHRAALEAGHTIGVLGCGIDVAYPPEHASLQERIARDGLLLTELSPGLAAFPHHFRRRNRIIAALAEVVVVVEAGARSGTLITVDHALALGRDVLAVPGPIGRASSAGTNRLLHEGARIVTDPADVLDELGIEASSTPAKAPAEETLPTAASAAARALWRALGPDPAHIDEVAPRAGLSTAAALAALLELELTGAARQLPGKRLARR